jgi:RNA methyltransferase, TrmH family
MISNKQAKLIRALAQKKYRKQYQQYLVQGEKNVLEWLNSGLKVDHVFATSDFLANHAAQLNPLACTESDSETLTKLSTLMSNSSAIAVVPFHALQPLDTSNMILALDGVSDPGNLGTIIRVADWYGFKHIVLDNSCADHYNPKVISATMGSFVRVNIVRDELSQFLSSYQGGIYGAFLQGKNVHNVEFNTQGVVVMGSESHGISEQVAQFISHPITIPAFGEAESLNVAMATGIILDNIKRGC